MSPRATKKETAPKAGELAWSVRGVGAPPAGILGGPGSEKVIDDVHLVELVNSLAYRVLELVPTLTHEEILEAVDGVDPDGPLNLYIMQKSEGMFGTLDTLDAESWIDGGGPQLIGKMHGAGRYQLRLQGHKNGVRKWIKQPIFQVPGRIASSTNAPPAPDRTQMLKDVALVVGALTPLIKMFIGDRSAAAPATDPSSYVKMFREGLELGKETSKVKTGGDDMSFGKTLRDLLPPALQTFRDIAASSSGAIAPAQQLPPAGAAAPPAVPAEPVGPPPPAWVLVMRPHVPELLKLAVFVADVDHWAAQVVGMVEEKGELSFFEEQLERGDVWRAEFYQYFPETIPHRDWFDRFFDAVVLELEEEEEAGTQ